MKQKRVSLYDINYDSLRQSLAPIKAKTSSVTPAVQSLIDNNLTEKQKCYIMLYYKQGLTLEQIGELFGVNPSTVSRTIARGRQRLLKGMQRDCLRRLFKVRRPNDEKKKNFDPQGD